ncbi:MAG: hypothetical protein LBB26_02265 [Puniceicoccales bacterium]|jgi:hypothetical protein|nr:hypothetical protein [Puniceicoccales bacterium]
MIVRIVCDVAGGNWAVSFLLNHEAAVFVASGVGFVAGVATGLLCFGASVLPAPFLFASPALLPVFVASCSVCISCAAWLIWRYFIFTPAIENVPKRGSADAASPHQQATAESLPNDDLPRTDELAANDEPLPDDKSSPPEGLGVRPDPGRPTPPDKPHNPCPSVPLAPGVVKPFDAPAGYGAELRTWKTRSLDDTWPELIEPGIRKTAEETALKLVRCLNGNSAYDICAELTETIETEYGNSMRSTDTESMTWIQLSQSRVSFENSFYWCVLVTWMNNKHGDAVLRLLEYSRFKDRQFPYPDRRVLLNFVCSLINEFHTSAVITLLLGLPYLTDLEKTCVLSQCPDELYRPFTTGKYDAYGRYVRYIGYKRKIEPYHEESEKISQQILNEVDKNRQKSEWQSSVLEKIKSLPPEVVAAAFCMVYNNQSNGAAIVCWYLMAIGDKAGQEILLKMENPGKCVAHMLIMLCGSRALAYLTGFDARTREDMLHSFMAHSQLFETADLSVVEKFFTAEVVHWCDVMSSAGIGRVVSFLRRILDQESFAKIICAYSAQTKFRVFPLIIENIFAGWQNGEIPLEVLDEIRSHTPGYDDLAWTRDIWRFGADNVAVGNPHFMQPRWKKSLIVKPMRDFFHRGRRNKKKNICAGAIP